MDKLQFTRLWDLYGGLLTATQREICSMYFNLDLTVTEIAEQKGITRQGVSECLTLCKRQLAEYEKSLGHDKLISEGEEYAAVIRENVSGWAERFLQLHPEYAADIEELTAVLDKDYAQEIAENSKKLGKE